MGALAAVPMSLEGVSAGMKTIADFGPGIIVKLVSLGGLADLPVVAARLPSRFGADSVHTGADLGPGMSSPESAGAFDPRVEDGNNSPPERL
jgi:hypothetical protein